MSLNDVDRISNLWKKSRGVNDIRKDSPYVNPAQTAFKENIFNNAIFSQEVPDELPGNLINSSIGTVHPESVEYLDWSFNQVGVFPGQIPGIPGPNTPQLGPNFGTRLTSVPHLTYYHRIQLFPNNNADDTLPTGVTKSTWYLPDPSDNKLSLLRDTINFKTGTEGHYVYNIWAAPPGLVPGQLAQPVQEVTDPYSLVFDNKNGLLYLYGDDSASNWNIGGGSGDVIYISFIRYEGSKGAAGGSGGSGGITPGSDVSFNNVDISSNLNIIHNGLETGILQSKSIALDSHSLNQFPRSTVLAEISYSGTQNPMTVSGYFTIELNEGDPHSYTKIHFIAGVMTKEGTSLSSPGGYEYNCFIKVLNVNRAAYGQITNPGIHRIQIWKNTATDRVFLAVNHDVLGNPRVKVRLYKNGPNELNVTNELQWKLGKTTILNGFGQHTEIKSIYIAAAPDGGLNPVYPDHPVESFSATTEYTIIDNSMNVYGNVNITGDVDIGDSLKIDNSLAVGGDANFAGNIIVNEKITGAFSDLYEYKIFTNTTHSSETDVIGSGAWQTIAHIPKVSVASTGAVPHDLITSNALFEVIDRSNPLSDYSFKDTISFIVNVTEKSSTKPSATLTLLSSNTTRNDDNITSSSSDYGYIEKIRVLVGRALDITGGASQVGALIQVYRKSNQPVGSGVTSLRINMYNNLKIWNISSGTGVRPYELDISPASYWRSGHVQRSIEFDLTKEGHGSKNMYMDQTLSSVFDDTLHVKRGTLSSTFEKLKTNSIIPDSNENVKILVDDDTSFNNNIVLGNSNNEATHSISFFGGNTDSTAGALQSAVLNLNGGSSGEQVKTGGLYYQDSNGNAGVGDTLINNVYTKGHYTDELCNPALVQTQTINLGSGGLNVANNDWVTIAVSGKANLVSRRASALFELTDRTSGHHHSIVFRAGIQFTLTSSTEYLAQKTSFIDVISNNFYSSNRFNKIRLKFGSPAGGNASIFGGAVLQVQIDDTHSSQPPGNIYLKIYQNTKNGGWISNSSVITKYGVNDQIPIWDTTQSANSGQNYTDDKTVYIQNNNRVETTVEKNFRFEDASGYPNSQKNSDTNWSATSNIATGNPLLIQINRWLNMGGSTIMNLWDTPSDWILDTNGTLGSNLDGIDMGTQKRGKTAINLRTVNQFYQKQHAPIRPLAGNRDTMINLLGTTKLAQSYGYTSGYHGYLKHQAAGTGNVNNPTNEALIFRHDEVGELCNVGNGYQQLIFSTGYHMFLQADELTSYASGDSKDSHIMWGGLLNYSYRSLAQTTSNLTTSELNGFDWYHAVGSSGGFVNFDHNGNSKGTQTWGSFFDYLEFTTSASTAQVNHEWVNDKVLHASSTHVSDRFTNTSENRSYIMPQKNMCGHILNGWIKSNTNSSTRGIEFINTTSTNGSVEFILCGVKFNSGTGSFAIRELCTLITVNKDTVWGRTTGTTSTGAAANELAIFYPNQNGSHTKTGQYSDSIYIGENGGIDERFDALRVRVKVKLSTYNGNYEQKPYIRLHAFGMEQVGYNFSPIIRSVV